MAIALILRFYKGAITLEDIKKMSFAQFNLFLKRIETITRLETGDFNAAQVPLTGQAAHKAAMRQFRRKK